MTRALHIHAAGPGVTIQDRGRPGWHVFGLSRGGAADRLALAEGAALLGQDADHAALEMAGTGGTFEATAPTRIALTGAPMRATIDGEPVAWGASHLLPAGLRLVIGPATSGVYGYLHLGGGIATEPLLGARSAHLAAGLGQTLQPGTTLPLGPDRTGGETGYKLPPDERFSGGTVRVVPSLQTAFFPQEEIDRFQATVFRRDPRGNRMGVRLNPEGEGFQSKAGLTVLSEVIVPGDIQVTGDGAPYVLLSECQTTGGYPRIGSVLPADLPRVAQAQPGATLRFPFIMLDDGIATERKAAAEVKSLRSRLTRLLRDPAEIRDLLAYQLISGVTDGQDI